jgi:p-aminobenzoyl-glutamate transporter AbgT
LQTLASGRKINSAEFGKYATTAEMLVKEYLWYYMPAAVYKVLMNGEIIIDSAVSPLGKFSEEASEAKNKEYKYARLNTTRKSSRTATNEDLIHALLVSSDPVIFSLRCFLKKEPTALNEKLFNCCIKMKSVMEIMSNFFK